MQSKIDNATLYQKLDDMLLCDSRLNFNDVNGKYRKLKGVAMLGLVTPFTSRISELTLEDSEYFRSLVGRLFDQKSVEYFRYYPNKESWQIAGQDYRFEGILDQNRFGDNYFLEFSTNGSVPETRKFSSLSSVVLGNHKDTSKPAYAVLCDEDNRQNIRGLYLSSLIQDKKSRVQEIFIIDPAKNLHELQKEIEDWPLSKAKKMLPSLC